MANQNESIVLSIEVNEGPTRERLKEITLLLASQARGYKELQTEIKKSGTTTEAQAKLLVDYKANIGALNTEARVLGKTLELNAKQQRAAAGSYDQLSAAAIITKRNLNELEGTLRRNADGTLELTEEYFKYKDAADQANKALIDFDLGVKSGGRNVGLYANSIAGMEQKLADLIAAQKQLDVNSDDFKKAQKDIDDTSTSLGILSGRYDEFGNKEPRSPIKREMDAIADATAGAISAFEIYNLTMGDSEEQNAAQERALRGIAIAQNLRNLQIGIANAGEAASVIITKASTFATNAKTKATGAATVATRVFNTVLKANPLGLVLTLLTAVAGAVVLFSDKFNVAAKIGKFFTENFSGVTQWLEKTGQAMGLVDTATEKALKAMDRRKEGSEEEIRVLEAMEGKERDVYLRRREMLLQEVQLLNRLHREKGKLSEEELKRRTKSANDIAILDAEEQKRLNTVATDNYKEEQKRSKERLEQAKKELEAALNHRKELLEISKGYIEERLKFAKEGSSDELRIREQLVKKQLEIENTGSKISREQRVLNETVANNQIKLLREKFNQDNIKGLQDINKAELDAILTATQQTFARLEIESKESFARGEGNAEMHQKELQDLALKRMQTELMVIQDYQSRVGGLEDVITERQLEISEFIADKKIDDMERVDQAAEDNYQKNRKRIEDEAAKTKEFIDGVNQVFADSLTQQGFSLKEFSKGVLMLVLDTIEKTLTAQIAASVASAAGQSFAQPDSVATFGATGIARSLVIGGLIKAAFSVAKAAISASLSSEPSGFYHGGYTTKGNPKEEATNLGKKPYTYHKSEYVVPARLLDNPDVIEKVDIIEMYRTGKAHMTPKTSVKQYIGASFEQGGYTSTQAAAMARQTMAPAPVYPSAKPLDERLIATYLAEQMKNMPAPVVLVKEITQAQTKVSVKDSRTNI